MALPGGGSLNLPQVSTTPQGTLPHIDSSKIYASYLAPSAGDKDEKSDSYVTTRADKKKMSAVEKEVAAEEGGNDEDTQQSKRQALVKEIEKNVHSKPGNHTDHKINLDKLLGVKSTHATLDSADDLHENLRSERNSFIDAAMRRSGYTPSAQVLIPTQSEPKKVKASDDEQKGSEIDKKQKEEPEEQVPSLSEIEKNPNASRSKTLSKNVGGLMPPPYASNS